MIEQHHEVRYLIPYSVESEGRPPIREAWLNDERLTPTALFIYEFLLKLDDLREVEETWLWHVLGLSHKTLISASRLLAGAGYLARVINNPAGDARPALITYILADPFAVAPDTAVSFGPIDPLFDGDDR